MHRLVMFAFYFINIVLEYQVTVSQIVLCFVAYFQLSFLIINLVDRLELILSFEDG